MLNVNASDRHLALVCILWVVYGYLAKGIIFGNADGGDVEGNIALTAVAGTVIQYIHVAFQGSQHRVPSG